MNAEIERPPLLTLTDAAADRVKALTVSYPHLRAHETEAGVVCRLLLEK